MPDAATNTKVCYPQSTTSTGGAGGASGTGGAGGASGTGGTGGAAGTRSTLSDGTVGSSCGTCGSGLTCIASVPGGYCSKNCQTSAECGAGASCHNDGGLICFRDCTQDSQCREGYACVLDSATNTKICYPQTNSGTGGASGSGGASGRGGTTGSGGGSSSLSDGSVGSSCGTCAAGLTCLSGAQIPGGYCSKACTGNGDCGAGSSCHNDGSYLCMRNCGQDSECRSGYVCKLDTTTQTKICYPGAQNPGGTGNGLLRGCYWRNRDITYRLYFDGVGSFQEPMYNPISGSITYSGRYQVSNNQLILQYSDGTTKTYPIQVSGNSAYIVDGSATYAYAEATCS